MLLTKILGSVGPPPTLSESDFMQYRNKTELKSNSRIISADICPVIWDDQIFAFEVVTSSGKPSVSKLNQLVYRMEKLYSGYFWARFESILITTFPNDITSENLHYIWEDSKFSEIKSISRILKFTKETAHVACLANRIVNSELKRSKRKMPSKFFGEVTVRRKANTQYFVIGGVPHLSINFTSPIDCEITLDQWLLRKSNLEMKSITVKDKFTKNTVGVIEEVLGKFNPSEDVKRLSRLTSRYEMKTLLQNTPSGIALVNVKSNSGDLFEYPINALVPSMDLESLIKFGINSKPIADYLKIRPKERRKLLCDLIDDTRLKKIVSNPQDSSTTNYFRVAKEFNYTGELMVGNGRIVSGSEKKISALKKYGMYRKVSNKEINTSILSDFRLKFNRNLLFDDVSKECKQFGFNLKRVYNCELDTQSYPVIESEIKKISDEDTDLLISVLPKSKGGVYSEDKAYQHVKKLALSMAHQNVTGITASDPRFKLSNICLGALAKLGNTPWVLAENLPYCDQIMGLDISRTKKSNYKGTRNEVGIPRYFSSNGDFKQYKIPFTQIDGEEIPIELIRELLPANLKGTKQLIHIDGKRPKNEIANWLQRGIEIDSEVMVVQVIKRVPFRIYDETENNLSNPRKGDGCIISENEAIVVSNTPVHNSGTVQPLHIKCTPNISIENAVHSVLALSDLHYGSENQPRNPVTTHDSHNIGKLLSMNVKPKEREGSRPYWL